MKPVAVASLDAAWTRKPMARAARVTLFEREIRERLSVAAVDILLARARILSEGRRAASPTAARAYFGSTMITIDVAALADLVREPCDARAAGRVCALIRDDPRTLRRVQKIAEREAARLAEGPVQVRPSDVRVRYQETLIYLDVDVEE
jgi:hypothetical protein